MRDKGFTLIELLIVIAIIGIIAAIAIPSLLNALDRARQATSVSNVLEAGKGVERYKSDHPRLGPPDCSGDINQLQQIFNLTEINTNPAIIKDGWGYLLVYVRSGATPREWTYTLEAYCADGADGPAVAADANGERIVTHFDEDIEWVDGRLTQRPEGAQTTGQ